MYGPISIDLAALPDDAVAPRWISPDMDALSIPWAPLIGGGIGFVNPPYSTRRGGLLSWFRMARLAQLAGSTVLLLSCAGPGSRAIALARAGASEILWCGRRLACLHPDTGEPAPANNSDQSVVVFAPPGGPALERTWTPPAAACVGKSRSSWPNRKRGE